MFLYIKILTRDKIKYSWNSTPKHPMIDLVMMKVATVIITQRSLKGVHTLRAYSSTPTTSKLKQQRGNIDISINSSSAWMTNQIVKIAKMQAIITIMKTSMRCSTKIELT